ncbi:hypothetical protein [Actinoallomurus sp. NPDC050550]|uniref:hypothetical protein n=1 Tax=Actinoallomurus sp. NPDC050550 TaxID=3154937 RepID=UPI0033F14377
MLTAASALAALAILGTACGGGHSGEKESKGAASAGSGASGNGAEAKDQQVKFAQCMRKNGVNMPDPKPGSNDTQGIAVGGNGANPEKLEKAMKACRDVAGISAPKPLTPEQKDKMIKFAACMREHGINMPDPKFDGGMAQALPSSPDKDKLDKATKACAKFQ